MSDKRYTKPIDISTSTVLITGASSGIGLGLAKCFLNAGASIIITGRRESQLKKAVEELNALGKNKVAYLVNDVEKKEDRQALFDWIVREHPQTNILINNAGIQQRFPIIPLEEAEKNVSWEEREKEILVNVCAPMHLSHLFIKHFRQSNRTSAIMNVSSGLAFLPLSPVAIYSATKAAIHSFTISLRYQLDNQLPNIQVYEIIPPAVQTNLGGSHAFGEPLDAYCQGTFQRLVQGYQEVGYNHSEQLRKLRSQEEWEKAFLGLNETYSKLAQQGNH